MARKSNVRWDGERHWFRLPYAASLSGKTKGELLALAYSADILSEEDSKGEFWFERLAILAFQGVDNSGSKARAASKAVPAGRKPKTSAQLERQWAQQAVDLAKANPKRGGGVSRHYEKVLLSEITEADRERKEQGTK